MSVIQTPLSRAEFRRFVLEHHPDRGGDPAVFTAGVRAWRLAQDDRSAQPNDGPQVFFYRKRSVLSQLLHELRARMGAQRTRPDDRRSRR